MELSTAWDTLCYIAGAVSIVGPIAIIWFYVRTVRQRLKKFNEEHPV